MVKRSPDVLTTLGWWFISKLFLNVFPECFKKDSGGAGFLPTEALATILNFCGGSSSGCHYKATKCSSQVGSVNRRRGKLFFPVRVNQVGVFFDQNVNKTTMPRNFSLLGWFQCFLHLDIVSFIYLSIWVNIAYRSIYPQNICEWNWVFLGYTNTAGCFSVNVTVQQDLLIRRPHYLHLSFWIQKIGDGPSTKSRENFRNLMARSNVSSVND